MKNTRAKDVMTSPVITVREDTNLEETARTMLDHDVGSVLVVDSKGELRGILTDSDFAAKKSHIPFSTFQLPQVLGIWLGDDGVERIYEEARRLPARKVMTERVFTVEEDDPIQRVLELMLECDIAYVPVMRGKLPVGIIARRDLLKIVLDKVGE